MQQNDILNANENELILLSAFNSSLIANLDCNRKDELYANENELIIVGGFNMNCNKKDELNAFYVPFNLEV